MQKAALLSVSDKGGLVEFAKELLDLDYALLCSGGTGRYLEEAGLPVIKIEEYTGQAEILGGRVKTLHPRIHAGILARRDNESDMEQLAADNIYLIDIVAVNLYPFSDKLEELAALPEKMVEFIDIGGPTMIRAAAKNFKAVYPVINPADYPALISILRGDADKGKAENLRLALASKVFTALADYNLAISRYLSALSVKDQQLIYSTNIDEELDLCNVEGFILKQYQSLRYGENPAQKAAYYLPYKVTDAPFEQLNGKALSYNNLLDFDAAFKMISSLPAEKPTAIIVKHLNPCGACVADNLTEALSGAKLGDPRSHFGGIIAFNAELDLETAKAVTKDFAEIVIAPAYCAEVLEVLRSKKNLRVIKVPLNNKPSIEMRTILGGMLYQSSDSKISAVSEARVATKREPLAKELSDLELAWRLCSHVKSNAITIVKDDTLLAVGGGQMSRIDAAEVALLKARTHNHQLEGSVAASDAFFPFPDCIEVLAQAGVKAILAPGGAKRDDEVASEAEKAGISLLFSTDRHFRH